MDDRDRLHLIRTLRDVAELAQVLSNLVDDLERDLGQETEEVRQRAAALRDAIERLRERALST